MNSFYFDKVVEKMDWPKLLKRLKLGDYKKKRDELWFICPFHDERTSSFSINKDNGMFKCFGCDSKGNLITLVAEILKISNKRSFEILEELAGMSEDSLTIGEIKDRIRLITMSTSSKSKVFESDSTNVFEMPVTESLQIEHKAYLMDRGVSIEIAKERGIRACQFGYFKDRLIIPIYTRDNEYFAFEARLMEKRKDVKKILYPKDSLIPSVGTIYNYYETMNYRSIILVEGIIDCLSLVSRGFRNVISCFGASLSDRQKNIIARTWDKVYILLDQDEAGRKCASKIMEDLTGVTEVVNLRYRSSMGDPKHLKSSFIRELIEESKSRKERDELDRIKDRLSAIHGE